MSIYFINQSLLTYSFVKCIYVQNACVTVNNGIYKCLILFVYDCTHANINFIPLNAGHISQKENLI